MTSIKHSDLGLGLDTFHPENKLADGNWESLVNFDPSANGSIKKRKGYQLYAGTLPIRVTHFDRTATTLRFRVETSYDISTLRSTPIIVQGKTSTSMSGDFSTTDNSVYYSKFVVTSAFGSQYITVQDSNLVNTGAEVGAVNSQLTIWGIPVDDSIKALAAGSQFGWVNHLDNYKSTLEERLIAGLGGNLFTASPYATSSVTHKYGQLYPIIQATHTGSVETIAPCFWETGEVPARTRGYITGDDSGTNQVSVVSVSWVSTGLADVVVSIPSMSIVGTPITNGYDRITLSDINTTVNGTHLITSHTPGSEEITFRISIAGMVDGRADDLNCEGYAGIFTDVLTTTSGYTLLLPGDVVQSAGIPEEDAIAVVFIESTQVWLEVLTSYSVGSSEVLYGTRTADTFIVSQDTSLGILSPANVVRGDSIETSNGDGVFKVKNVGTLLSTGGIVGDGTTATFTVTSAVYNTTASLSVNDKIIIIGSPAYAGIQVVSAINSLTQFEFLSSEVATVTGVFIQRSITLDRAVTLTDGTVSAASLLRVPTRWIPIELTSGISERHFSAESYDAQSYLKSAMSSDNMYFTNGEGPVMKYDGTGLVRAGLPRWQSALGIYPHRENNLSFPVSQKQAACGATSGSPVFTITAGHEERFTVGDLVHVKADAFSSSWVGRIININTTAHTITLDAAPTASIAACTMFPAASVKYYTRLNLIDGNRNVIASAQSASNDLNMLVGIPVAFSLLLCRFPDLAGIVNTNLELELYRTGDNSTAPYMKITTVPISSTDITRGYINITDVTPSSLLTDDRGAPIGELDPVASVLIGEELGFGWDQPPIGKYITATSGRLLLGNIKDYEEMSVTLRMPSGKTFSPAAQLHGKSIYLRRDGATSTTANSTDVFGFQFVEAHTGGVVTLYGLIRSSGTSITITTTTEDHETISAGDWIYLFTENVYSTNITLVDNKMFGWHRVVSSSISGANHHLVIDSNMSAEIVYTAWDATADTITSVGHGLVTGDIITLGEAPPTGLTQGRYNVIRVDSDTIKVAISLALARAGTAENITATGSGTKYLFRGFTNASLVMAPTQTNVPIILWEPSLYGDTTGDAIVYGSRSDYYGTPRVKELQLARKLSHAVNAVMTQVDNPFLSTFAGNDYSPGEVVIRRLDTQTAPFTIAHDISDLDIYVAGSRLASATLRSATRKVFPSRICRSYKNYAELFDSSFVVDADSSDSAIDINPSDGQQITGFIPFFGDSAFGTGQKEAMLLVFKERSVYIVDVESKSVQRLETRGQGCTYPRSIAYTMNGVMFANETGIYSIGRDLTLQFKGQIISRSWEDRSISFSEDPCATHNAAEEKYLLSHSGSQALVFDHTREAMGGQGSWTSYDSIPATWWANSANKSYFSSTQGAVYKRRDSGEATDYRDDESPIVATGLYKAMNFGASGVRKLLGGIIVSYRVTARMLGTIISTAADHLDNFSSLDQFEALDPVDALTNEELTALSDVTRQRNISVNYTPVFRRAQWAQLKIENSSLDEPVEVTELEFEVAPMKEGKGLKGAGDE